MGTAIVSGFVLPYNSSIHQVGTALYVALHEDAGDGGTADVRMYKSTDGGSTWVEQDSSNRPTYTQSTIPNGGDCLDGSDDIHCVWADNNVTVHWIRFDTGSDIWDTGGSEAASNTGMTADTDPCVAVRSDGDVLVWFLEDQGGPDYQVSYSRRESSTWTKNVLVAGHADGDIPARRRNNQAPMQSGDIVYIYYYRWTAAGPVFYRSINSSNTVGSETPVDPVSTPNMTGVDGTYHYLDGATHRYVGWERVAAADLYGWIWAGSRPTERAHMPITSGTESNPGAAYAHNPATGRLYCLWVEIDTNDIYYNWSDDDDTFNTGTLTELEDAVDYTYIPHMAAKVFTYGGGTYLGWIAHTATTAMWNSLQLSSWEQEGYRWRDDNGGEDAADWHELQDVDTTQPVSTIVRVRVVLNATGDPAPTRFALQYRKVGDAATEWEDVT